MDILEEGMMNKNIKKVDLDKILFKQHNFKSINLSKCKLNIQKEFNKITKTENDFQNAIESIFSNTNSSIKFQSYGLITPTTSNKNSKLKNSRYLLYNNTCVPSLSSGKYFFNSKKSIDYSNLLINEQKGTNKTNLSQTIFIPKSNRKIQSFNTVKKIRSFKANYLPLNTISSKLITNKLNLDKESYLEECHYEVDDDSSAESKKDNFHNINLVSKKSKKFLTFSQKQLSAFNNKLKSFKINNFKIKSRNFERTENILDEEYSKTNKNYTKNNNKTSNGGMITSVDVISNKSKKGKKFLIEEKTEKTNNKVVTPNQKTMNSFGFTSTTNFSNTYNSLSPLKLLPYSLDKKNNIPNNNSKRCTLSEFMKTYSNSHSNNNKTLFEFLFSEVPEAENSLFNPSVKDIKNYRLILKAYYYKIRELEKKYGNNYEKLKEEIKQYKPMIHNLTDKWDQKVKKINKFSNYSIQRYVQQYQLQNKKKIAADYKKFFEEFIKNYDKKRDNSINSEEDEEKNNKKDKLDYKMIKKKHKQFKELIEQHTNENNRMNNYINKLLSGDNSQFNKPTKLVKTQYIRPNIGANL